MEYPDINDIRRLIESECEKNPSANPDEASIQYYISRYKVGLQYYIDRIDNLLFSGNKVLDAGCGSGAWAIALTQRYNEVVGRDMNNKGLRVFRTVSKIMNINNIQIDDGSLEQLPYTDCSFDDIFCYSVIMLCNVSQVLNEFFRVLKPGGRVYLCLNDEGYYHYLINERGKNDKVQEQYGRKVLYNTFWKRYLELSNKHTADSEAKEDLHSLVEEHCGYDWVKIFDKDYQSYLEGKPLSITNYNTRSYSFLEIEKIVKKIGFVDYQSALEGSLILNQQGVPLTPLYHGYHKGIVTVWECVFTKPAQN